MRFTIIQTEIDPSEGNGDMTSFIARLCGQLRGYEMSEAYDWTFANFILYFAAHL